MVAAHWPPPPRGDWATQPTLQVPPGGDWAAQPPPVPPPLQPLPPLQPPPPLQPQLAGGGCRDRWSPCPLPGSYLPWQGAGWRNVSKRVLIVLEMVPITGVLGFDRLFLCDASPFGIEGNGKEGGTGCFLGIAKLSLGTVAFIKSNFLMPFCLVWWFIDAALIIDNALRGENSIHTLGLTGSFDPATVPAARDLSFAAAAQFGLELALFLPALLVMVLGTDGRRSVSSAVQRLRPSRSPGLSAEDLESATSTILYTAGTATGREDELCSICCDVFQESDCLRVLPCKHRYHVACVDRWLRSNCTCPLCKGEITRRGCSEEGDAPRWERAMLASMEWQG